MVPMFSVVGYSNSGKTTIIKQLVKHLKEKGYKVAVIKHDPLDHGEVDKRGSDTQIFFEEGGADTVALSSPSRLTLFSRTSKELSPESIIPLCDEVDCVILEGYKGKNYPKILVLTGAVESDIINKIDKESVIALVFSRTGKTDEEKIIKELNKEYTLPQFLDDDVQSIVNFLEKKYFTDIRGGK